MTLEIRAATEEDWPAIWAILEPVFRAGETYAVETDISEDGARTMWVTAPVATYVAIDGSHVLGTYYLKKNQAGPGNHICNCGYVTGTAARGRGIARAMCAHSLIAAKDAGFTGMSTTMWSRPILAQSGYGKAWDLRSLARSQTPSATQPRARWRRM